ncbi:hypothetical protein VTO42DRAFT_1059 [Malbranchea cinnamomea]
MSASSSAYEPEQDDESSEHDIAVERSDLPNVEPSSPPLQNLTLASTPASPVSAHAKRKFTRTSGELAPKSRSNALRKTRSLPIDKYLELFNESVNETLNPASYDQAHHTTRSSQHGIVTWSAREKNVFFDALAKKGKDSAHEIAALVGTKSAIEVQDYMKLLRKSLEIHHRNDKNPRSVRLSDIPAAIEIDDFCCMYLDKVAEAALLRDEQSHNTAGKRKHQDMWLVNRDVAAIVDGKVQSEEHDLAFEHELFATASLFNLSNWIELSETVFMNSGRRRPEDNWKSICFEGESPALTCEAFSDFYALAVSLTRRLVQSAIFFALSRIRSLKAGGWHVKEWVRKEDVQAALDVLRLKPNSREFWRDAARRCSLDVRATVNPANGQIGLISYDEVEERLSRKDASPAPSRATSVSRTDFMSEDENASDFDLSLDLNSGDATSSEDESSFFVSDDDLSDPEEIYASKLDIKASREEEARIWKKLDRPAPTYFVDPHPDRGPISEPDIKMETDDETPLHKPFSKRKTKDELVDWRDLTLYRSEWEALAEQEAFEHRRKRQRVDRGLAET